ncbi:hypothetical protein J4449_01610 [Candidatus Woesearchaeota archaeon]|nr:hypothetical protein [Candidatus Woesearchaeota archaeon]
MDKAYAHCPLCTVGAVAAAGGAAWLGLSQIVIGLFIGAFAISLGLWSSRYLKKKYVPIQNFLIALFLFLTIVLPVLPLMKELYPFYINISGDYGSLLNRTYIINSFLGGGIIGGIIVFLSPFVSMKIMKLRNNKLIPYQGVLITLLLLIIAGVIFQLTL